jgi:hypothetical protein
MDNAPFPLLAACLLIGLCAGAAIGIFWLAPALGTPQGSACPMPTTSSNTDLSATENDLISFLFVQEGDSGSLVPGKDGTMTLTLTGVRPETVYFSDKPARVSGVIDTVIFNASSLWHGTSSPNAALMIPDAPTSNDTVILSLSNPRYNRTSATIQYSAVPVPNYIGDGLKAYRTFADPMVQEQFGQAMLFIDNTQLPVTVINTTSDKDHPDIIVLS